ncbi:hypothetical protein F4779DRAFT_581622 [Xylariaceae sp. FL0662B]|nr:hypothetical protein F4779DRAFT_581622 [Xylariaceae sp. FL0662B]
MLIMSDTSIPNYASLKSKLAIFAVSTWQEPGDTAIKSEKGEDATEVDRTTFTVSRGGGGCQVWVLPDGSKSSGHTPDSSWRWNCCSCGGGNLSYIFDTACLECGHRRC